MDFDEPEYHGGNGSPRKKIILIVSAVIVLIVGGGLISYFVSNSTSEDSQAPQLKITHKATLLIGDRRGRERGQVVIGLFGEHAPVTVTNFESLANHNISTEFGFRGSQFTKVFANPDRDYFVEGGAYVQTRKEGLAIYDAGRLDRRYWARRQDNADYTWETGAGFAKDNLTSCCRREGWVAMKDISFTGGENPAYSSIFRIFALNVTWEEDDKDLLFGKVLEGMDVVKDRIQVKDLVKDSRCEKLETPVMLTQPGPLIV